VELHCHSAYSFLDGASLPGELVERAAGLGHRALALTDHDSLCGAMELAVAARESDVRAIFGAELSVLLPASRGGGGGGGGGRDELRHLTLLVRDREGWRNLCRLLTEAHAHTRDTRERRAGQPAVALEEVLRHAEGLLCLSGCAARGVHERAPLERLREAFGPEWLRVELQRPYARNDRARNRALERLARGVGVATVATGDVHAHTAARALLQDALVALRHGCTLDSSEIVRRPNHAHVLATPRAMAARFVDHPEAVAESVRVAEALRFDLTHDLGYRYPGSGSVEAGRRLRAICEAALEERYPVGAPGRGRAQAEGRLREELAIIDSLDLAGFFVLHHEIFVLAREVAREVRGAAAARALLPPGRGRGSSVSSIVCYLSGLSHIDPIASQLEIGRFLHEDITAMPDIDLDFPRDVRERLIPRVHERYGPERSALVAAFPTFRARGAIRELGKALGLPPGEIERVARTADGWGGEGAVAEAVQTSLGSERLRAGRWRWLARLAEEAHGLPRHLSQHSGGMIISTAPLVDCCPVVPAAMRGRQIVQWDKDSCADARFLKIDLLGLGMLSAVERCVELIAGRTGERVDLSRIPFDDPATFECIQRAETTGVFQIESRAQMGSLRRTRPASLADLTVQVALVRPGPIVGGAVNPYIERRQRQLADSAYEVPYEHPSLAGPLHSTLGTIVFQDQVIEVARAFAGFTAGQAERLRRAMSRKRSSEAMDGVRRHFIEGALAAHPDVDEHTAERVWGMVAGFAGFGFPKAHGAAFGLLAYQSTWLRVHHPAEFLCALLDEQPMGFYAPDSLIHEAQRRGLRVWGVDVNHSHHQCTVTQEGAIRLGLRCVKGLREEHAVALVRARDAAGPFASPEDLAARAGLPTAALERLAWAGACDELAGGGPHARRAALWRLGIARPAHPVGARAGTLPEPPAEGPAAAAPIQLALELEAGAGAGAPALPALGEWEAMLADYTSTGASPARHPLGLLRERLAAEGLCSVGDLANRRHGSPVEMAGLVIARQRPSTARGVTFLLLEDEHGTVNVVVPPPLYGARRGPIRTEPLLRIAGRLERHPRGGGAVNVVARAIEPLGVGELAELRHLPERERSGEAGEQGDPGREGAGDFRAVAPPVMSFARGRRR